MGRTRLSYCLPTLAALSLVGLPLAGCVTADQAPPQSVTAGPAKVATSVAKPSRSPMRPVRPVALRDASSMQTLDQAGVEQLIGPPTFVRHDGGATIWQYQAHGCVMDLFWYRSDSGLSLLYVEARDPSAPRTAEMQGCLDDLWNARLDHAES